MESISFCELVPKIKLFDIPAWKDVYFIESNGLKIEYSKKIWIILLYLNKFNENKSPKGFRYVQIV